MEKEGSRLEYRLHGLAGRRSVTTGRTLQVADKDSRGYSIFTDFSIVFK